MEEISAIILNVCRWFDIVVSEAKPEAIMGTLLIKEYGEAKSGVNSPGRVYKDTKKCMHLEAYTCDIPEMSVEIEPRTQQAWTCCRKYRCPLYD